MKMNGEMKEMKTEKDFKDLLLSAGKGEGMKFLFDRMVKDGFFKSPCSGQYHLCVEGGLAEHSWHVYETMDKLAKAMLTDDEYAEMKNSIIVVSILHDLGKMGDYGKPNYVPNYVQSKTKNKETGEYDKVLSTAKPYATNPDLTYEEHEIRSLTIASRYIDLTEDEYTAILHHNGLYGKLDSSFGNANFCKTKLAYLLHTADMWCTKFMEV